VKECRDPGLRGQSAAATTLFERVKFRSTIDHSKALPKVRALKKLTELHRKPWLNE
jgi:hypothetical protein